MTVTPRATTRPALRHRLLPDVVDETPGNAAQVYLLAMTLQAQQPADALKVTPEEVRALGVDPDEVSDRLDLFLQVPLDKLPREDVQKLVDPGNGVLRNLDAGALREECRWELPIREQGFALLLPHLQAARGAARLADLRTRLYVARGDYDAAARSARTTLELARDLNDQPFLIQSLVGAGIATGTLKRVEELVQRPDAPNLYWPLAGLPRPFMDLGAAVRLDLAGVYFSVPQLKRIRAGQASDDDLRQMTQQLSAMLEPVTGRRQQGFGGILQQTALAAALHPNARAFFAARGEREADLDAVPPHRLVARYIVASYDEWAQELQKWTALPYWQAAPGLAEVHARFAREVRGTFAVNPLLNVIPAVNRAHFAGARLDRQIAALQTVEALRAYAAAHDGKLPAKLEEMTETPAPVDPMTGKVFAYTVDGGRAVLESPAPPGGQPGTDALRVEVTIARGK